MVATSNVRAVLFALALTLGHHVLATDAQAENWYVDSAVPASGNGQSWTTAWKSFSNIVWGNVRPGDTVFISGGTTTKSYSGNLVVSVNGTSNDSRVTVRIGQDPGHNGRAVINGGIQLNNRNFVTVDGEVNRARHIEVVNNSIQMQGTTSVLVRYLEIHGRGATISAQYSGAGVQISFNHLYDISEDAAIAMANPAHPTGYHRQLIDNNIIDLNRSSSGAGNGSDGIQGSWGLTIENNVFRNTIGTVNPTQHQDYIQMQANYMTIRGNTFISSADSSIDYDTYNGQPDNHRIYNNVFILPRGSGIRYYNSGGSPFRSISNILIANNTFVNHISRHQWALSFQFFSGTTNPTVANTRIQNNLFYDNLNPVHIEASSNASQANWNFDFNLINAGPSGSTSVLLDGSSYAQENARTEAPAFVKWVENPSNFGNNNFTMPDLRLAAGDTAAVRQGVALTSVFTTDKDGVIRPQEGAWDIGAYQRSQEGVQAEAPPAAPTNLTVR